MFAAVDCAPSPTIVCELDRIADSLASNAPTGLEWAQFWVSAVSAVLTLAVGVLAAYLAYRSHKLSETVQEDNRKRVAREARAAFSSKLQEAVLAIIDSAAASDDVPKRSKASLATNDLGIHALASQDPVQVALAQEVNEFRTNVESWGPDEQVARTGKIAGWLMSRTAIWVRDPQTFDDLPDLRDTL